MRDEVDPQTDLVDDRQDRTPPWHVHAEVAEREGRRCRHPITYAHVYALGGFGSVGKDRIALRSGQLAILGAGDALRVEGAARQDSRTPAFDVLLLGGRPIGEPVIQYGPFVMNTREEIAQAIADYQAGRMGQIPATHVGAGPR